MKEKLKCMWWNLCEDKYLCCNFCNKKNCIYRCKDDANECKYAIGKKIIISESSNDMIDKIKKYVKDNNWNHLTLFKNSSISYHMCRKILEEDSSSIKLNKNSKEEILKFINDNNL